MKISVVINKDCVTLIEWHYQASHIELKREYEVKNKTYYLNKTLDKS